MPNHCAVCGNSDFTRWEEYSGHMRTFHNVTVVSRKVPIVPVKTSNRTKGQIVEALERKLGKEHFFNTTTPSLEDDYVTFMRRYSK